MIIIKRLLYRFLYRPSGIKRYLKNLYTENNLVIQVLTAFNGEKFLKLERFEMVNDSKQIKAAFEFLVWKTLRDLSQKSEGVFNFQVEKRKDYYLVKLKYNWR